MKQRVQRKDFVNKLIVKAESAKSLKFRGLQRTKLHFLACSVFIISQVSTSDKIETKFSSSNEIAAEFR